MRKVFRLLSATAHRVAAEIVMTENKSGKENSRPRNVEGYRVTIFGQLKKINVPSLPEMRYSTK